MIGQLFQGGTSPISIRESTIPRSTETWKNWTQAVKDQTGRKGKGLFMPLRKAVTGMERGPEMGDVMPLMQVVKARGLAKA